ITVHAGQQQFPCPHLHHLSRPFNRIQPGGLATAMGKDFPAWLFTVSTDALGVYGHHDALAAETVSGFPHEVRVEYRRGVDRHFVCASIQQLTNILYGTNATPYGQRDEHFCRHALYGFVGGVTAFAAGSNIQEGNFVGALFVVAAGHFNGITGIADVHKVDAFDHAAFVYVQAGDDALCQCHGASSVFQAVAVGLGFCNVQGTFVNGSAGDGTDHAFVGYGRQALEVVHIGHAAGGNHRNAPFFRQLRRGFHVHTLHHAVAGDVGVNDGGHAVVGEALGQVYGHDFRDFSPAVGGYAAVFGVQADDDVAWELFAHFGDEFGLFNGFGADDHPLHAGLEVGFDGFRGADAAANLDGQFGVFSGDGFDNLTIDRLAGKGAIEVNQVQAARASLYPFGGHVDGVVTEYGGVVHAALAQSYAFAVFQIDCGDNQHFVLPRSLPSGRWPPAHCYGKSPPGHAVNTSVYACLQHPCCRQSRRALPASAGYSFLARKIIRATTNEILPQLFPVQFVKFSSNCRPARALFSGWNCTAKMLSLATAAARSTPYRVRPAMSALPSASA